MIAYLEGEIKEKGANFVVILTKSGVGYLVFVPPRAIKDKKISLFIFHYQTEKSETLYGFPTIEEKKLFGELLKIRGLGPKGALALLSVYKPSEVLEIIKNKDLERIKIVPGIGSKLARKIITDFTEALEEIKEDTEVKEALKSLGFNSREVAEALKQLDGTEKTLQEKIVKILKIKGKNG
jgi:Holliday junction DNA helicase RuvA